MERLISLARNHLLPLARRAHLLHLLPLARAHLLPLARAHLLPLARDRLLPYLKEVANIIRGLPKEIKDLEAEHCTIQDSIYSADRKVAAENDKHKQDEIKQKVKQLAELAYQIEDVIDEYKIHEEQQSGDLGRAALPRHIAAFRKTVALRLQIAHKIQSIKSQLRDSDLLVQSSPDQGASSSTGNQDVTWQNQDSDLLIQSSPEQGASSLTGNQDVDWQRPRKAYRYMDEADIVGFETPSAELVGWLVNGREERTAVSVVGMGGRGKTTLAKIVFDNHQVIQHFDLRVWITVSESYTVKGLLKDMLNKFYKQEKKDPPQNISTMKRDSLIDEVRKYLEPKRYFILFDDVWRERFWSDIGDALIDKKKQSRILITTRDNMVADNCNFRHKTYDLQPLSEDESWDLFCKKAFLEYDGRCPSHLEPISREIVVKCHNLPLAIVAIGGALSRVQPKTGPNLVKFSNKLSLQLKKDGELEYIIKILDISYNELPSHLKPCFLHFGIYPEDYEIEAEELIRLWVAEGFAKDQLSNEEVVEEVAEEVAEKYLQELIGRNLVQVSSFTLDGNAKKCHVHDLLRKVILEKFKALSFCDVISEDNNKPSLKGMIRRVSIVTDSTDFAWSTESPHLRSLYAFANKDLQEDFVKNIPDKYRLLKVLHFRIRELNYFPSNLGNLIHLKYLSFEGTWIDSLPECISDLRNLETLNLRGTKVSNLPKEIGKLRKLRHLYGDLLFWIDGIGSMSSLQTLQTVRIRGDEQVRELEMLKQIRSLGVLIFGSREQRTSFPIDEMKHLETLDIQVVDLQLQLQCSNSSRRLMLQRLTLEVRLHNLPEWFHKLQLLVELKLWRCELVEDPLPILKNMPSLLSLTLDYSSYEGDALHFQDGWFHNLKQLRLMGLNNLKFITIAEGALQSLEKLHFEVLYKLEKVPEGIQYLRNLRVLQHRGMLHEFRNRISADGEDHWIVQHVPVVRQIGFL